MNASRSILWWMCVWMGMCVGYEIYGLVVCAMNDEKKCPNYPDIMFAMQITSLVMKTIFITCGFMTCKIYRCSEQRQKQVCPCSGNTIGVQPPTYDQSMGTSKY